MVEGTAMMKNFYRKFYLFKIPAILLFFHTVFLNFTGYAADFSFLKNLSISQVKYASGGVLVVRPAQIDLDIVSLIKSQQFKSLDDYSRWLKNNVRYQNDASADQWADPQETLLKKSGDCEDYTFLTMAVLRVLGYQPRFLALRRSEKTHAICIFQENGYFSWFDNTQLKRTKTTSLAEFSKYIAAHHTYSHIYELDLATRQWNLVFKRT